MDLFEERWRRISEQPLRRLGDDAQRGHAAEVWPESVDVLFLDQPIGIARTLPQYAEYEEVREVEQLYLDTIARARETLYLENQYLTSRSVCAALCQSLQRPQGPQVVIVLPQETGQWLEQHTMDVLRGRVIQRLRAADRHDRLRVFFPLVEDLPSGCLMVHAKLMIADDRVLRLGSSNLSNRSMGLDSECDVCVVACSARGQTAIARIRRRLLGMFLSVTPDEVAEAETAAGERGLIGVIEILSSRLNEARSQGTHVPIRLEAFSGETDPEWGRQLPDERLIDPDRALDTDLLTEVVVGDEKQVPHVRKRVVAAIVAPLLFIALAVAWRWTPLGDWLHPDQLTAAAQGLRDAPWGYPVALLGFVAASLLAIPVTLLILVAALVFGGVPGAILAMTGSLAAAFGGYRLGEYLGRPLVERMSGGRVDRLSRRLARHGIVTMVTVRIVPVAPFAVLNLFAGASHLRLRDFMLGTLIGMTPAIVAMALFAQGLLSLLGQADLRALALVVLGGLALAGLVWLGRWMLNSNG